jgi:capsular polysaccharide biosynthesis protein
MEWQKYLQAIKDGWWIVVLTVLTSLSLALITAYYTTPLYRSKARLVIGPSAKILASQDNTVVNSLWALDSRSISSTYAEILISQRIFSQTAQELQLNAIDLEGYSRSSVVLPDANVLELTIDGPDPETTANLANKVSQNAIEYIQGLYVIYDMNLLDPATTSNRPFKPTPVQDAFIATFLGAVFGIALTVIRSQLEEYISMNSFTNFLRTDRESTAVVRRYFIQRVDEELKRNRSDILSLGLLKLNSLQNLEANMPPLVWQQLLRRIVRIIKNELRNDDVVARWGETSFSILFPTAPEMVATRTMDSIKGALQLPLEILETGEQIRLEPEISMIPTLGINKVGDVVKSIDNYDEGQVYNRRRSD